MLVHPESPESVVAQADVVGSTSQLIAAAVTLDAKEFIVATDNGILHKMRMAAPGKVFMLQPIGRPCGETWIVPQAEHS